MTEIELEKIIKQRIELCEQEIEPIMHKKFEELKGIKITRKQFEDYVIALGQTFVKYASEVKEPTLSVYDNYCGRTTSMQMVYKLICLMKAPKVPFICDDGDTEYEDYKCGSCGHRVYEDDNFCSECGVSLYFEEENSHGQQEEVSSNHQ